jgi:hypothetical protein
MSERDPLCALLDEAREQIGYYRRRAERQAARAGRFKAERDRAREALRAIAHGDVPLGQWGEMSQAMQDYAERSIR